MASNPKRSRSTGRRRHGLTSAVALSVLACGFLLLGSDDARADLRLCNKTESQVGVAIGYKSDNEWVTEGWWNISPSACETLVPGTLVSRYYYIYAVDYDQFGEWGGRAFMCTREKEFTIRGIEDCVARGYERTGFFEIDTGEQSSWTVQLTEPVQQGTGGR
ncbi:DUF1036 domain-containing protein [Roseibium aquae]|uniref:DUF1036 domain-containing protein n=1 Tax=Roseibium aquae TaxID=1323746 RepID=UPI001AD8ACB1|nr:DUF1036 domain-containing protein [Roseibium aquae]